MEARGIGTQSAQPSTIRLYPAPPDHGIVFCRTDGLERVSLKAHFSSVRATLGSTLLGEEALNKNTSISTVEHLMAALYAVGVHNVFIEVEGPEIPIMDGSSAPFVYLLKRAGLQPQEKRAPVLKVLQLIEVTQGSKRATLQPGHGFSLTFSLSMREVSPSAPANLNYQMDYTHSSENFMTLIAPARTFGFLEDVELLRARGIARGSSLDNVLVFSKGNVINSEGTRFENEPARHKILDAIGDLSLCGYEIEGHFEGVSSGHGLNHNLLCALFSDTRNYQII